MTYAVGLDLGSSFSSAAYWNGRNAEIIELPDGSRQLPSVVAIVDGKCLVGAEALDRGRAQRQFMFRHFKRRMGERFEEASESGWQTSADADGLVAWNGPDGVTYSTVELSSYIISALLDAAEAKLGERPTQAVITIPADSTEAQRAATLEAGRMAGLEQVDLMHEPTAAALSYGYDFTKRRVIAVPDAGGSTFDISIIETGKGRNGHALVEVLATDGRRKGLGGMDFDSALTMYLANRFRTINPDHDLSGDKIAMERVTEQAELAKIRLSGIEETSVRVPDLGVSRDGVTLSMQEPLDVKTLAAVSVKLTDSIAKICQRAVEKAKEKDPNFSILDIHDVVLVGGMTRSPVVREAIKSVFGREPLKSVNPAEAVALGAAIEAARISGRKTGLTVRDIISQPICIETLNNVSAMIFPSGSPVGSERTVVIRNANDNQAALSIAILEGSDLRADQCSTLATYHHVIEEPGPAKSAGLKLKCKIDERGRFSAESEDGWSWSAAS